LMYEAFDWIGRSWRQHHAPSQELIAKLAKDLPARLQLNNLRGKIDPDATTFCLLAHAISAWRDIDEHCAKMAKFGQIVAQYVMGRVNEYGLGRARNLQEAFKWYHQAAIAGLPRAQNALGRMFMRGLGVARNAKRGATWVRQAAEQGYPPAQFNLGFMHEKGLGVKIEAVAAANWYRRAAEHGHARAQFNLASRYVTADGLVADMVQAYKWLVLAAIPQGVDPNEGEVVAGKARRSQRLLAAGLTPAQLEEAKAEAAAFRPK